jgi:hypothetical protein
MKISVRVLQVLGISLRTGEGARYCGCAIQHFAFPCPLDRAILSWSLLTGN